MMRASYAEAVLRATSGVKGAFTAGETAARTEAAKAVAASSRWMRIACLPDVSGSVAGKGAARQREARPRPSSPHASRVLRMRASCVLPILDRPHAEDDRVSDRGLEARG